MTANPAELFAIGKDRARRNDLPKLGAIGPRRIDTLKAYGVSPNTDEQNAAFRRVEHERIEAQNDADYRQSLIRIFGKNKPADFQHQHAAIDAALLLATRDGRGRDTDHILSVAADEYVSLRTELPDFLEGQQAKMDAKQEALEPKKKPNRATFTGPVTVPPAPVAPPQSDAERDAETEAFLADKPAAETENLHDIWTKKMLAEYGKHAAAIEFARATGRKDWKAANADGVPDDVIAEMLESYIEVHPASVDAAPKPAAKPPARVETPAPVADVPVARNDAPSTPEVPPYEPLAGKVLPVVPRYEEWPFVALLTLYSPEGLEMKYTIRAASDAALFDAERAFVARRIAAGYTTARASNLPVIQQPALVAVPAAPVLPTAQPAPLPYAPLPETVATAPAATSGAADKKGRTPGTVGVDRIVGLVRNEKNGAVSYELWAATGIYCEHELRIESDIAMLAAALPNFNLPAMQAGTKYTVALDATWVAIDKWNKKQTYYYRNVTAIQAVA